MNNKGWVKSHRSVFDWEWLEDAYVYKFFDLAIKEANPTDSEYKGRKLKRGQFVGGRDYLALRFKMSKNSVDRCIECLKASGEIKVERIPGGPRIITIVNYDKYQVAPSKGNNKGNNKGTLKEYKESSLKDTKVSSKKKKENGDGGGMNIWN